jgi:hypothetical protein
MKEFKWGTYLSFRTTAAGNNRSIHVETLSIGVQPRALTVAETFVAAIGCLQIIQAGTSEFNGLCRREQ